MQICLFALAAIGILLVPSLLASRDELEEESTLNQFIQALAPADESHAVPTR